VTDHRRSPHGLDHQFICDIDLSSFGCPWECYLRDTDRVRAEFPGPEDAYYRGKRSFLEALLRRSRIFQTDFFNSRYEQQARENIERLLELIDRGEH
jgi:predicted metal-dependent HD superfamily phosphohydrolase